MPDSEVLILIPARMASSRLPGKPLADIGGRPMIAHVVDRAREAQVGPVAVATDSPEIAAAAIRAGAKAVMTRPDHASGSDRIFEALDIVDPDRRARSIVNLQGDLPTIAPATIRETLALLSDPAVEIATAAALIRTPQECSSPHVVKVVGSSLGPARLRALYFTRARAPWGEGPLFHHIGIYAYRRTALKRFVELPSSPLEAREKLEQLRALEAGMRIDVALVDTVPLGVDTPRDLDAARAILAPAR